MELTETELAGAHLVDLRRLEDDRGFFARTFCRQEFLDAGLDPAVAQCNLSFNHRRGTLRGLHLQVPPAAEVKLVRCTAGAIVDVIVDLRPDSPTYLRWIMVELSAANRRALYVPKLFAHGYQTLTDGAEVSYQVSAPYVPGKESGIRHDDPALAIPWPEPVTAISEKDASWPDLAAAAAVRS